MGFEKWREEKKLLLCCRRHCQKRKEKGCRRRRLVGFFTFCLCRHEWEKKFFPLALEIICYTHFILACLLLALQWQKDGGCKI